MYYDIQVVKIGTIYFNQTFWRSIFMINKKANLKDVLVLGFALFAMFFGAGNLIFPPYLGFNTADQWFVGFICFILADVGLAVLAMLMLARTGKGAVGITEVLGSKVSFLLIAANAICLGPLIAIPRTAATTYELGVYPLLPSIPSWVSSIVFFVICIALCLKQSKVVDIIGSVLSPLMVAALAVLIIKGIITPIGEIGTVVRVDSVVKEGIAAGYQTMDMLAGVVLSIGLLLSIKQKGYESVKDQSKMIGLASVVAAVALFLVYGGLAYLGATTSAVYPEGLSQAELVVAITKDILGQPGVALLGFIVMAACLTTAIGLISSFAEYVTGITNGKIGYKTIVIATSVFSCVISNFGISTIISLAAPILELIYPVFIVLVVLAAFSSKIKNNNIYKFAAGFAFLTSVFSLVETFAGINLGVTALPLASYGFPWAVPALIGVALGVLIKDKKDAA